MTWEPTTIYEARDMVFHDDDYEAETGRHVERLAHIFDRAPDGPLFDFGCGIGRLAIPLSERTGRSVYGYDTSPRMIELACEERTSNDTMFSGIWPTAEFPSIDFAGAYSMLTFQHMGDHDCTDALAQITRLLAPRGLLVVQFAVGFTQQADCWERGPHVVQGWMIKVGLEIIAEGSDAKYPTWWWLTGRKA